MPAKINLLNQRIGKLTVVEETTQRKNNSVVWKCQCDCGNIEYFSTKELRSDGLVQCYKCGHHRQPKTNLTKNIIGQKFNSLTVIESTNQRQSEKILYKCLCDCGQYTFATKTDLQSGHIKSCGCSRFKYKVGDIINNKQILEINPNISKNHDNKS